MRLTPQQQEVTAQLRAFIASEARYFILKGYAGTGKTFLIGQLAKEVTAQNREVMLLAPTGRAARVLSKKTGFQASTIHRAIYNLKELVEINDQSVAFKFYFRLKDVASDNMRQVVFVDEASMLSDQYSEGEFFRFGSGRLLTDLLSYLRMADDTQMTKIVMVGDPAQLPPVDSPISPALDPAYISEIHQLEAKQYELTDVVRQGAESAILREATAIRKTLFSPHHNRLSITPCPPEIEAIDFSALPERFLENNDGTRVPRSVCVAYSNATCLNLNVAIRSKRFGADGMQPPLSNDVLLVIRNSASTGLLNGDLISVSWADSNSESYRVKVGDDQVELIFRSVRLVAEAEDGSTLELGTKIVENVLFSEKRDLSPSELKALYVLFKIHHPRLRPNTKEFTEALRADPFFNALQVKFGYAMTCHKAQGGEWDDVFVYFEHARTDAMALRWAYTALTRARHRIIGMNLPNREPWGNVMPSGGAKRQGNLNVKEGEDDAVVPAEACVPTKWDELFPKEPSCLCDHHRRMAKTLEGAGIVIQGVEVRDKNYFWRYDIRKDDRQASLRINFNRRGDVTPQLLPVAGSDPALGQEAFAVVDRPTECQITFPADKPFLSEFYEKYMLPKARSADAIIARIEHQQFHEKYHFSDGMNRVVVVVYYTARGTISRMIRESGDEELSRKILEDA